MHNFIQQSLDPGYVLFQFLPVACWRFAMVKISDNESGWKLNHLYEITVIIDICITDMDNMVSIS